MQLMTQQNMAYVSGGKVGTVNKRAEDIVSGLSKMENAAIKMSQQLERVEEDVELVKTKVRHNG